MRIGIVLALDSDYEAKRSRGTAGRVLRGGHPKTQFPVELVLQHATVRQDDLRGREVVRLACDQRRGNTAGCSLGKGGAKHGGRVATTAGGRSDVVPMCPPSRSRYSVNLCRSAIRPM